MEAARQLADARSAGSTCVALVQLMKPAVTRLVVVTMVAGAAAAGGPRDWWRFAAALVGTTLVVGAANALNMFLERDLDALMERTRVRPLPQGRLSPEAALGFGLALAGVGLALLVALASLLVAGLALFALLVYVLAYTPMKRRTPWALHVGAIPGALPPLIGWAAATGELSAAAMAPFLLLYTWQLPHFLAISLFRRDEYARAGLRVHSVVAGVAATRRAIVGYAGLLLGTTLAAPWLGVGGPAYLVVAATLGLTFLALAIAGLAAKNPERAARRIFLASLPHLVLVLGALVALPA